MFYLIFGIIIILSSFMALLINQWGFFFVMIGAGVLAVNAHFEIKELKNRLGEK